MPETDFKVIWVECDGRGIPVRTTYIAARGDMPESDHNLLPWKQEYQVEYFSINLKLFGQKILWRKIIS